MIHMVAAKDAPEKGSSFVYQISQNNQVIVSQSVTDDDICNDIGYMALIDYITLETCGKITSWYK